MPLEVRIDVVPNGIEALREQLGSLRITQVEKLDRDPDGLRRYLVVGVRESWVEHRRKDGYGVLVSKALASQFGVTATARSGGVADRWGHTSSLTDTAEDGGSDG